MKTITRQLATLRLIPLSTAESVQWVTVAEIVKGLRRNHANVCTSRTVQRDLHKLSDEFGLDYRCNADKSYSWSRHKSLEVA